MPAKLSTICYIHDSTQRSTKEYSIKEITGISRLSDEDPTKIIYLKIKAFVPLDKEIDTQIEKFENGQVNATSIKPMPSDESVLNFHVEENLGNREPKDFWLEMRHNSNINYLANKTNSINQTMRSTMAILSGLLYYQESIIDTSTTEESIPGKHILKLDDISLISSNRPNMSAQSINLPWLNQESTSSRNTPRTPRGSTPRLKRGRVTLSQLSSTRKTRSQSLASALQENPLPTMTQNETSSET
ncbi:hypothetical protein RhiirC2_853136 [Rhizophagus irregularis]|uniref:Uncharacterized protein n=1 Tax=Rhizophagus irregularis TaxID=588596 RepID=A0A2N1MWT1_9GLOM|nr:hypothetical protein RhiirC2_853136 [Rhizophagus irregularis]